MHVAMVAEAHVYSHVVSQRTVSVAKLIRECSITGEECLEDMEPLSTDTVRQRPDGSVEVRSPNGPTLLEDLSIDGPLTTVRVYVVRVEGDVEQPLTTPSGEPEEFSTDDLPTRIAAVAVIIIRVDNTPINPDDVSGKICTKGEATANGGCILHDSKLPNTAVPNSMLWKRPCRRIFQAQCMRYFYV